MGHENRGLAVLLAADTLIRQKIYKLNHDKRKDFPTFVAAMLEVLTNQKQLWNDARSSAELEKFRQAEHESRRHPESEPDRHRQSLLQRRRHLDRRRTRLEERSSKRPDPINRKIAKPKSAEILEFLRKNGRRSCRSHTTCMVQLLAGLQVR